MPPRRRDPREKRPTPRALPAPQRKKHLIIDGYNLIHSRPEFKKSLNAFGTDAVRDALIKALSILHDYEGWRLTIVFDGRGEGMSVEYPMGHRTLGSVFSPSGISADEIIQGLVEKFAARDDLAVATSDGGIRVFIQANGARWLPTDELWRWVDEANASVARALKRR